MLTTKQVAFILCTLILVMAATIFLLIAVGNKQPTPPTQAAARPAFPDSWTPNGPDVDLQKVWRDAAQKQGWKVPPEDKR